jgi:hypothetical protein
LHCERRGWQSHSRLLNSRGRGPHSHKRLANSQDQDDARRIFLLINFLLTIISKSKVEQSLNGLILEFYRFSFLPILPPFRRSVLIYTMSLLSLTQASGLALREDITERFSDTWKALFTYTTSPSDEDDPTGNICWLKNNCEWLATDKLPENCQ